MGTLAEALAEFCASVTYEKLPTDVASAAHDRFLDWLGVALGGATSSEILPIDRVVRETAAQGMARTMTGYRTTAPLAALVNGCAAHAHDFDDTCPESMVHIGAPVIAAALATAETVGASGAELLAAVVVGYEVASRIGKAINRPPRMAHHRRGFHPTGTCAVFGAAVAASRIFRLPEKRIARALGIAGSLASGILEFFSDGSMTKRFHAGKAAHDGVLAAWLAAEGLTGPVSVLEGRDGFLRAYGQDPEPDLILKHLGLDYSVTRITEKFYACCAHSHTALDMVLEEFYSKGVTIDRIEHIRVHLAPMAAYQVGEPLERKYEPQSALAAQMSLPYCVSVALHDGRVFPQQFTTQRLYDPSVRRFARRVRVISAPDLSAHLDGEGMPAELHVVFRDGREWRGFRQYPSGSVRKPLTRQQREEKFRALASLRLAPERIDELRSQVLCLHKLADVNKLLSAIA